MSVQKALGQWGRGALKGERERGGYTWRTVSRHKKKHLAAPFGAVFDTCAHRLPTKTGNEKISSQARAGCGGGQVEVVSKTGASGGVGDKKQLGQHF